MKYVLIALAVYVVGVIYFGLFVALPILLAAVRDRAFPMILGYAVPLVFLWPIALPVMVVQAVLKSTEGR